MARKSKKIMFGTVAILDAQAVLLGFKKVSVVGRKETKFQVPVPDECDLTPKKYRWDAEAKTFVPLPPVAGSTPEHPDQVKAIALGFMALREAHVVALPKLTLAWLDWYAGTIDYQGGDKT